MKKIMIIMLVIMLFTASTVTSYAGTDDLSVIYDILDNANDAIQEKIDAAVDEADDLVDGIPVEEYTPAIEDELDRICDTLIDETNLIAATAFAECGKYDVDVVCVLVPVDIANRTIMVDPLIVIGD